jgi:hypothetical protein
MLKICGATLLAIVLSVGVAQARMAVAHPHRHLGACADGMTKAACVCGAKGHSQVCKAGQWCHSFEGACRS